MRYIVSLAVLPVLAARCGPDAGRTGASLKRHPIPVSSGSRKLPETGEPVGIYGFIPRIPTVLCSPATCPPAILPMTAAGHTDPSTIPTGDFRGCITSAASISAGKPPISDMPERKATGCSKQRTEEKAGRGCPPPPSKESSTGNLHCIPISTVTVDPSNPDCVWAGTGYLRRVENRGKRRLAQGRSTPPDGGRNWTLLPDALPRGEMALRILMFEQLPGVILVVTDGGIYASRDAGKTFSAMMKGLPEGMTYSDIDRAC